MKTQKMQDQVFGIIVLAVAAFYTVCTLMIPVKEGADIINARTMPLLLAALMWILGICQLVTARKSDTKPLEKAQRDLRTVFKTAVLIVVYIALFEPVGFIITTMVYLFLQFIFLTPADKKPNFVLYGVIAVVDSVFVYTIFRYSRDIILPQGLITFF